MAVKQICKQSSNDESDFVIDGVEVANITLCLDLEKWRKEAKRKEFEFYVFPCLDSKLKQRKEEKGEKIGEI